MEAGDFDEHLQSVYVKPRNSEEDIFIHKLIVTTAVITVPHVRHEFSWYIDRWCYRTVAEALVAAANWNPETEADPPDGWLRHLPSGRRRPDGRRESEETY